MPRLYYSIGDRYGKRVIIGTAEPRVSKSGAKATYVRVRCDCGREDEVRLKELIDGRANQCVNCSKLCNSHRNNDVSKQPWYSCWNGMMQRCHNPNNDRFYDYGGRGIKVCDEWHDSWVFGKWAEENGFQKGLQIDRINNDGNYEPSNCRWVTPKENMQNRRNTIVLTINHVSKSINVWCEEYGLIRDVVQSYHDRKNLSWEDAFFLALGKKTCKEY